MKEIRVRRTRSQRIALFADSNVLPAAAPADDVAAPAAAAGHPRAQPRLRPQFLQGAGNDDTENEDEEPLVSRTAAKNQLKSRLKNLDTK